MKSAALELGQYNITVNAVIPNLSGYTADPIREAVKRKHR